MFVFFFDIIFMTMLVYLESMVWSIIANGVVDVKYKNVYKTKLMVLNCRLFLASPCWSGHDTLFEAADRWNVVCHCVSIAATSLPAHIKPRHAPLSLPFRDRVW